MSLLMILFIFYQIANFNTNPISRIWTFIGMLFIFFCAWNVLLLASISLQATGILFYLTVVTFSLPRSHFLHYLHNGMEFSQLLYRAWDKKCYPWDEMFLVQLDK